MDAPPSGRFYKKDGYVHAVHSSDESWSKEFYSCGPPTASCSLTTFVSFRPRLEANQPEPGLLPRELRAKPASLRRATHEFFLPCKNVDGRKHGLSCFFAQNHSIEGGATYFRVVARGGMLCKSVGRIVVWRECPAAQKVSYLRPPSQLSIPRPTERPTERPTDLLLLKTSARFRPRSVVPHNRRGLSFSWLWCRTAGQEGAAQGYPTSLSARESSITQIAFQCFYTLKK